MLKRTLISINVQAENCLKRRLETKGGEWLICTRVATLLTKTPFLVYLIMPFAAFFWHRKKNFLNRRYGPKSQLTGLEQIKSSGTNIKDKYNS